jgi:hypothetical protein
VCTSDRHLSGQCRRTGSFKWPPSKTEATLGKITAGEKRE